MIRILIVIGERGEDCGNKDGGNDIEEEEGEDEMSLLGCHSKMSLKRYIPMRNRRKSSLADSFYCFFPSCFPKRRKKELLLHGWRLFPKLIDSEQGQFGISFSRYRFVIGNP